MKKDATPLWGLLLIGIGVVFALRSLGIFHGLNFWFWISLIIIIPSFIRLFTGRGNRIGHFMGIAFGFFLMMYSLDVISFGMLFPLMVAAVFVVSGFGLLTRGNSKQEDPFQYQQQWDQNTSANQNFTNQNSANQTYWEQARTDYKEGEAEYVVEGEAQRSGQHGFVFGNSNNQEQARQYSSQWESQRDSYQDFHRGSGYTAYTAVLSGRDINFNNEVFDGVMLSAVLGGIDLDLRYAIITKDVTIDIKAILGGVDIIVPRNVKVVVHGSPILGSVEDKTISPNPNSSGMLNCPTIYVNATCVLGGIEVKY